MVFTSSSARPRRATLVALSVLAAGLVEGAVLRRSTAAPAADGQQVANLLNVKSLIGSVSQVRGLQVAAMLMEAVPEWATPMPHCVKAVNGTLTKLSAAYLPAHVPTALHQACEDFHVYQDIGGDTEGCRKLMAELAEEFSGKRNYYPWCRSLTLSSFIFFITSKEDRVKRNYYPWCRSLTLSSFDVMKKMKEMFEANETLMDLRNQCGEHCPYVAKMMEASASVEMFMQKFMMESMQNEDPEKAAKDMMKMLEIMMRQFNQLCDWRHKATCNSANMHSSCMGLLEASGLNVEGLEQIEKECDSREPCRKACPGVDTHLVDFTLDQFKFVAQLPLPSEKIGGPFCKAIDTLSVCTKKEECETYLAKKVSRTAPSAAEYFESWGPTCEWFKDSCAAKRETACPTQVAALTKEWQGNFMCMMGEELSEECCKTLEEVAACDAANGCAGHLAAGVPLLDFGLEKAIPKQCPNSHTLLKFDVGENASNASHIS